MAQITIVKTDDLSKAQETELLEKIVANLHEGSYLRNFLSDQAVSWLKQQYENWTISETQRTEANETPEANPLTEYSDEKLMFELERRGYTVTK